MREGVFISIEGGEGAGKSTQISALAAYLRARGIDVVLTREPGGTEGAEAIRNLLLGGADDRWGKAGEALLFAAARSDHVEKLIKPALAAGKWVISDRYVDSSRAYQGASLGLGDADIMTLHAIGSGGLLPQRTLVLDLPPDVAAQRLQQRDAGVSDRIGGRSSEFHAKVRAAFLQIAEQEQERVRIINADETAESVTQSLVAELSGLLPE
ncbi:dTMP kinase [Sphingorhabdus pulchriflava]|uniref:Thymidylate kinase n=1 Tax=Sphingorhabdus pulchriflava TaxID=2292257 RepID=A0A371BGX6_9SPHN|nr:dTMP kinase [Sphingorhabdus pulchriflava]RDV06852.1 dTMP kinase [Sphingorhabdus pulchriflava]